MRRRRFSNNILVQSTYFFRAVVQLDLLELHLVAVHVISLLNL